MKALLHAAIKDGETAKRILNRKKNLTEEEKKYLLDVIRQAENAQSLVLKVGKHTNQWRNDMENRLLVYKEILLSRAII